jgi:hypothetical protein
MRSTLENLDPYLYPGTSVLRNLRGLTDPENWNASRHAGPTNVSRSRSTIPSREIG